jgi:hypothetical protein
MSTQTLKERFHRIIGYIETRSDGTQVIKDDKFRILGYCEPKQNQTKNEFFALLVMEIC